MLFTCIALVGCTTGGHQSATPENAAALALIPDAPVAETRPVTDSYHGVEVTEDYRWLEDASDAAVIAWTEGQDAHARSLVNELPGRAAIRGRISEILHAEQVGHWPLSVGGDRVFALRHQPPAQQAYLVVFDELAIDSTRVLVDPNTSSDDSLSSIDWFRPSPDGSRVAVSMSRAGTEMGDITIFDTDTGEQVDIVIPRVNGGTAGGDLVWSADGAGFWYTRYPRDGEQEPEDLAFYVRVYFHRLGETVDTYEIGMKFPRIAEIDLEAHHASGQILATVQDGDGGEFSHYLRKADGTWHNFSQFGDRTVMATFAEDGDHLFVVSLRDHPRGEILRLPVDKLDSPSPLIAEGDDTIVTSFWGKPSILNVGDVLYVTYQKGGPSEIRAFDLSGRPAPAPNQLPVASAGSMVRLPDGAMAFSASNYTTPWDWYRFNPDTEQTEPLQLTKSPPVDFDGVAVSREFATSKDGTQVPVNILAPSGATEGEASCVLTGYGGYGVSLSPRYWPGLVVPLERGVIMAVANLRGGGEYGEEWHLQGNLTNKQNVFDDMHAAITLLASKHCAPDRIAIMGGSNGGLLMGAVLTQHPDEVAAVASAVGIYDMLRVELHPNGAFNVTEFGTVKDEAQFTALHAYSPYHNVIDGEDYPPVLFTTGMNDPRVDPAQSRKMTARLQAANSGSQTLLRVEFDAGHGSGTPLDVQVESQADTWAFLLHHLGIEG